MESRHLVVMMTDIQGFTRATSGMGREQVEGLLALHEDLLVPVIRGGGGTIVKGLGDAFLVTFESPTKAVQAGARIQEVLAAHNRDADPARRLHVRVALNAGEVNIRDEDVFGEAVNITARVEGVCAAGQVTLTEAVHLLLDREVLQTEYLEEVELKGIPFPVKLYRVVPDWLPPEDRDLARARSTPADAPPGGPRWRGRLGLGALVAAAVAGGAWLARPPAPADLLAKATAAAEWDRGWRILEGAWKTRPTPELRAAGAGFARARIDARIAAGEWAEAAATQARFAALIPGEAGLSRPQDRSALLKDGARAYRQAGRFEDGGRLLAGYLAAEPKADDEVVGWLREDLTRAWDAVAPPGQEPPRDLSSRAGSREVSDALARLRGYAKADPWVRFVAGMRRALSTAAARGKAADRSEVEAAVREIARAVRSAPALAGRREVGPALEAALTAVPHGERGEATRRWLDPFVADDLGAWVVPRLRAWARAAPGETREYARLLGNLHLRRNARRIAARRGEGVPPDAAVDLAADLRLLAASEGEGSQADRETLLQEISLQLLGAPPAVRARWQAELRGYLAPRLAEDGASGSWRKALLGAAEGLGMRDLLDEDREAFLEVAEVFSSSRRVRDFKPDGWHAKRLGELAAAARRLGPPYGAQLIQLVEENRGWMGEKVPELLPALAALEKAQRE